ncbi:MAG: efflux RND transporter periplasmic adaptor subunit [Bacteroidia bacterium]|nr:MAG: efflux RND transporter periplasmic adaptor subunit [Bacteroidia bacterium]
MNKTIRFFINIAILTLLIGIIAYPKVKPFLFSGGSTETEFRPQQRPSLRVSGIIISPTLVRDEVRSTGNLLPDEEVDLAFETSGKVIGIYFQEGSHVKEGDLLAKMNDRHLQAQLQKLQAQRRLLVEREFRQRSLLERDAISQEAYDQAVTELETLDADVELLKARIAETEVRAPFDGVVGLRYLSEGSFASPSTRLAKLIKISPLKLEFTIPERYAGDIEPGFPVLFSVDGILEPLEAEVYAVNPIVDERTRTIRVRALYDNVEEVLKPGRFASITLQLAEMQEAIAIPSEALIPEMEGDRVFVYRSGRAHPIYVRTGIRMEDRVQILEGLSFGDTLLTTGVLQLRQGISIVLDNMEEETAYTINTSAE